MEINLATSNWLSFPAFPLLSLLGSTAVSFTVLRFDCALVYNDVEKDKYTNMYLTFIGPCIILIAE
jgi:hypothetical protein